MLSSPNRIIKVKRPITKVSFVPVDEIAASDPAAEAELSQKSAALVEEEDLAPPENIIKLTEEAFQQELAAAYEKGLSEGMEKGFQEAEQKYAESIHTLQEWLASLQEQQIELVKSAEEPLLRLTLNMAEKILGALAQGQKKLIHVTLKKILAQCELAGKVKLFVHPDDLAAVEQLESEVRQKLPDLTELTVLAENSISRGGCIIETSLGKLDARIETQLKELTTRLTRQFRDMNRSNT